MQIWVDFLSFFFLLDQNLEYDSGNKRDKVFDVPVTFFPATIIIC